MKPSKKNRKRRSRPVDGYIAGDQKNEERRVVNWLVDAFNSASLDEATSAYEQADGNVNRAAEILEGLLEKGHDCPSNSTLSENCPESNFVQNPVNVKGLRESRMKKVVASSGSVSCVLGKDYTYSGPRKDSSKWNLLDKGPIIYEEDEQFLCSMLGDGCELSMAVVRDVLSQCGYDVEKALDVLLDLSSTSTYEQFENASLGGHSGNSNRDSEFSIESCDSAYGTMCSSQFTERESYATSHSSENELPEILQPMRYGCRDDLEVLVSSNMHLKPETRKSDLPQKVLESLFNIPKSSEHEPNSMDWKNLVKKLESFGQGLDLRPDSTAELQQNIGYAEGDEYHAFRKAAKQHRDSMTMCYQKAATAYTKKERGYAAYLSEQGRFHNKMAREADEKASLEIFAARNKRIENVITIDLHGQHVKEAIRFLKVHLLFSTYISSIQFLRVITGCGTQGVGMGKVKQSVISLLKKEGVEWSEENRGTVLIRLGKQREFDFLESESDE